MERDHGVITHHSGQSPLFHISAFPPSLPSLGKGHGKAASIPINWVSPRGRTLTRTRPPGWAGALMKTMPYPPSVIGFSRFGTGPIVPPSTNSALVSV